MRAWHTSIILSPSGGACDYQRWLKSSFRHIIWCVSVFSFSLGGTCIVVKSGLASIDFSLFFFLGLCVAHVKNYTSPLIYFFFWSSSSSLNCNCFIYIDCFKLNFIFRFHPWLFEFVSFFLSNLILIILIAIFLVFIHFLDLFVFSSIPSLTISFHWISCQCQFFKNCYILIIFLIDLFFFSIPSLNI